MPDNKDVYILYTNYKGETQTRHVVPKAMLFTSTSWHPEDQWCLLAYDLDKEQDRFFTLKDVHKWWTTNKDAELNEPEKLFSSF